MSYRGYLHHFDQPGLLQAITFRLADSVPGELIERWRAELGLGGASPQADARSRELRERIERYADGCHGACWLRAPGVAAIVQHTLRHFTGERYELLAWCVMPNHVHALIETRPGHPVRAVVHTWKSFAAKAVNRHLGRSGPLWQADYFDRYVRDPTHLERVIAYIEANPVKARLCGHPSEWRWSSAWEGCVDG